MKLSVLPPIRRAYSFRFPSSAPLDGGAVPSDGSILRSPTALFWLLLHAICCLVSLILGFHFSHLLFHLFSPSSTSPPSSPSSSTTATPTSPSPHCYRHPLPLPMPPPPTSSSAAMASSSAPGPIGTPPRSCGPTASSTTSSPRQTIRAIRGERILEDVRGGGFDPVHDSGE